MDTPPILLKIALNHFLEKNGLRGVNLESLLRRAFQRTAPDKMACKFIRDLTADEAEKLGLQTPAVIFRTTEGENNWILSLAPAKVNGVDQSVPRLTNQSKLEDDMNKWWKGQGTDPVAYMADAGSE